MPVVVEFLVEHKFPKAGENRRVEGGKNIL